MSVACIWPDIPMVKDHAGYCCLWPFRTVLLVVCHSPEVSQDFCPVLKEVSVALQVRPKVWPTQHPVSRSGKNRCLKSVGG